jgi:two-component system NtrC family sensor kinase
LTGQVDPRAARARPEWSRDAVYRALLRHALLRLVFLYFIPLLLLTVFFHVQYRLVARDAERRHLRALAEHQAAMLDLFLGDRLLNLTGLTDEPQALLEPDDAGLAGSLAQLQAAHAAFVDLAVLDADGRVLAYAGPFPELRGRSYRDESWFQRLLAGDASHVITDVYLGFRGQPHYTMALKLVPRGRTRILRAVISPEITAAHLAALDESAGVALPETGLLASIATNIWLVSAVFCLIGGLVIWLQARWVAAQQFSALQKEQELTRQLVHAAKLATVGELSAGIAHEVNNPLAVVAEKSGLIRDLLDPRFGRELKLDALRAHLEAIEAAVYRATSITRSLLGFVRRGEYRLVECDVHALADELIDGMLKSELSNAGTTLRRDYDPGLGPVVSDPDQLRQVLLNLLKNAADAVAGRGEIIVRTRRRGDRFVLEVEDTGVGMTAEQLERVFMPFFTTKAPGKGTGLGLSVSYGIVDSLGGRMSVRSSPGDGTTFTVDLPVGREA